MELEHLTGCIFPVKKRNGKFKLCGCDDVRIVDAFGSKRAFCPEHLKVIREKMAQGKTNNNHPEIVRNRKKLRVSSAVIH